MTGTACRLSVLSYLSQRTWPTSSSPPVFYTELPQRLALRSIPAQDDSASAIKPLTGTPMLHYAVVFLVIALIAAVLGFGGIAAGAASIAKILFVVFLIMAVVSFIFGYRRR